MNIIKLNAINSTNDYLKKLLHTQYVENFTVVVAEHQTGGRGQMGSVWETEQGKNLTFSILIKDLLVDASDIFILNAAIAVSVVQALEAFSIPGLAIKWPNDILAGNKKIGGILIENSFRNGGEIFSVAGIGLNINQVDFKTLPQASSLRCVTGREYDKNVILNSLINILKQNLALLMHKDSERMWLAYHKMLFKKNVPMPFESTGKTFMGIIQGVTKSGNLQVLLEDNSVASYNIKEVKLLY